VSTKELIKKNDASAYTVKCIHDNDLKWETIIAKYTILNIYPVR